MKKELNSRLIYYLSLIGFFAITMNTDFMLINEEELIPKIIKNI